MRVLSACAVMASCLLVGSAWAQVTQQSQSSVSQSNVSRQVNISRQVNHPPPTEPPPEVRVEPAFLDFGVVPQGNTGTRSFVIANDAPNALPARVKEISVAGDFAVSSCPAVLLPGKICEVTVDFTPTHDGTQQEAVTVSMSVKGVRQEEQITVLGSSGGANLLSFDASQLDFGTLGVGSSITQVVTLSHNNAAPAPAEITNVSVSGADFVMDASACPVVLNPTESCQVVVTFAPPEPGSYERFLRVEYLADSQFGVLALHLRGQAVSATN